ncbi:putative serine/threonine protein kinase [Nocardia nova SH22a]|uniref:non-specific serine/threonine protein kinase n=1 Tax=Nocardia nova SH22a TaxID=1415166 RepID=W5TQM4_9NOCA|nr:serine/threonine-protein kinase [Nocardia nova]AHH21690.1 putative serine/threonine protein kinase [Nocardia nova SH22a]
MAALGIDEMFAGYLIEGMLGRGGMGTVYIARHPRLPRRVALKLLDHDVSADNELRRRFDQEAEIVARLEHPGIVRIYDRGADAGHLWISMEYVRGADVSRLDRRGLSVERVLRIIAETGAALDYAHSKGVLHRDIKPANILLKASDAGRAERAILTDFGIARLQDADAELTVTGALTATLAYASPEQLSGEPLDHRCDQYSLACTLFTLLCGAPPYAGTTPGQVVAGHVTKPVPRLTAIRTDLPPGVDAVMARAMAKQPRERYDSCGEFVGEFRNALYSSGFGGTTDPQSAGWVPTAYPQPMPAHSSSPGPVAGSPPGSTSGSPFGMTVGPALDGVSGPSLAPTSGPASGSPSGVTQGPPLGVTPGLSPGPPHGVTPGFTSGPLYGAASGSPPGTMSGSAFGPSPGSASDSGAVSGPVEYRLSSAQPPQQVPVVKPTRPGRSRRKVWILAAAVTVVLVAAGVAVAVRPSGADAGWGARYQPIVDAFPDLVPAQPDGTGGLGTRCTIGSATEHPAVSCVNPDRDLRIDITDLDNADAAAEFAADESKHSGDLLAVHPGFRDAVDVVLPTPDSAAPQNLYTLFPNDSRYARFVIALGWTRHPALESYDRWWRQLPIGTAAPPTGRNPPEPGTAPWCYSTRAGDAINDNGPGGTGSGPDAVLAYEYARYTTRSAATARQYVVPDSTSVPSAQQLQAEFDQIPPGTQHCVHVTGSAIPDRYQVQVFERRPDRGFLHRAYTAITTGRDGGVLIKEIRD